MRKLLLALFALALVVAFTAPSYAADFKMTGLYQVRGSSNNVNADGDDDADDKDNYLEALIRPRFTATSGKGAVKAMWEPEFASPHSGFKDSGRQGVGINRWTIDFAIPGSALRMQWGRNDYASPDKEIYDSGGSHRYPGVGIYGKLSKNMSLSMFYAKKSEDATEANADVEDYYASVSIKVSPTLTLSPWAANTRDGADDGYNYSFLALNAKSKVGILSIDASGVVQDGEIGSKDQSGWAFLVRTSASLGKLKLMGNLTMLSGDDDPTDNESSEFAFPHNNDSGWLMGSHIMSSRRWDSINNDLKNTTLVGNARSKNPAHNFNGAVVVEGVGEYALSKTLSLGGSVSIYNSAESHPGENMDTSKEFGTEINAGFKWKIHPGLELRAVAAVLLRGDYGRAADGPEPDDGWAVSWRLRHSF